MAAHDAASGDADPNKHVAAEPLRNRHSLTWFVRHPDRNLHGSCGKRREPAFQQTDALLHFANAHPDASVDIAFVEYRHVKLRTLIWRVGEIAASVKIAPGSTAHESAWCPALDEFRVDKARCASAILQRRCIVVEFHGLDELWFDLLKYQQNVASAVRRHIFDAPRNDAIHHQPVPEGKISRPKDALAEDAALSVDHGKAGVIANRAYVAKVVGDAFEFRHDATKHVRPLGHFDLECGFNRARERETICNGRVAQDSRDHAPRALDVRIRQ